MYCVIIATRTDFRNLGMCYDLMTCNSKESALKQLEDYHRSNCQGNINCNDCYFYDDEYKKDIMAGSDCRKFCKLCEKSEERQDDYCKFCKYCKSCDECVFNKCENCKIYCSDCNFKNSVENFKIPDYEDTSIVVKVFMTETEIQSYGVRM